MNLLKSLFSSEKMQQQLLKQFAETMKKNGHNSLFIHFDEAGEIKADFQTEKSVCVPEKEYQFLKTHFLNRKA